MSLDGTWKQKGGFGLPRPSKGLMAYDENTSPAEDEAKEQALLVMTQLVNALSAKYSLMKTQARAIVRQAMMEI